MSPSYRHKAKVRTLDKLSKDIETEGQKSPTQREQPVLRFLNPAAGTWNGQHDQLETWGPRICQMSMAQSTCMNAVCTNT